MSYKPVIETYVRSHREVLRTKNAREEDRLENLYPEFRSIANKTAILKPQVIKGSSFDPLRDFAIPKFILIIMIILIKFAPWRPNKNNKEDMKENGIWCRRVSMTGVYEVRYSRK